MPNWLSDVDRHENNENTSDVFIAEFYLLSTILYGCEVVLVGLILGLPLKLI